MSGNDWWRQECPARGATLTHAHWDKCDPNGVHPHDDTGNEGNNHPPYMCCHCQMTAAMASASNEAVEAREAELAMPVEEHEYQGSFLGRCVRRGCGRPPDEHIQLEHVAGQCAVKHGSITQRGLSIGDGGLQWKECPGCGVKIEPRMSLGEPQGRADGIGRGWVSPRMWNRWEDIYRQVRPS